MRVVRQHLTVGFVAVLTAIGIGIGTPAAAAPPPGPIDVPTGAAGGAPGGERTAGLVVGLRPGADPAAPADRLTDLGGIDVVDTGPLGATGAVTVEVAAGEAGAAAAVLARDPAVAYVEPDHVAVAADLTGADPYRADQWGTVTAGVGAAWRRTTGSTAVTVAVVDSGVSPVSDLVGALLPGYNAITGGTDARDDNGHGTQVATVLAARGNNRTAVAGVCWTCKILPVKVLGSSGYGDYSDVAEGIVWAADHGADIINLSLGGTMDGRIVRDAVAHAVARGVLVVAAAGNDGTAARHYPAAIPTVLAVGASTATDARYDWSSHGADWVDIAAPGCNPAQTRLGAVRTFCGTSSAAPFLSGVAALALSVRPGATAAQVRAVLTGTATRMPTRWVASGRVNAAATVDGHAPTVSVRSPTPGGLLRGTGTVAVDATDDTAVQRVELLLGGRVVGVDRAAPWAPALAAGRFSGRANLSVRVYDLAGRTAGTSRAVTVDSTAPAVRLTRAARDGVRRIRGTAYVAAAATDFYGVQRVELLVNGRVVARDTRAGYSFGVRTWQYGHRLRVQVRAYDRAGNARYTAVRTWYR